MIELFYLDCLSYRILIRIQCFDRCWQCNRNCIWTANMANVTFMCIPNCKDIHIFVCVSSILPNHVSGYESARPINCVDTLTKINGSCHDLRRASIHLFSWQDASLDFLLLTARSTPPHPPFDSSHQFFLELSSLFSVNLKPKVKWTWNLQAIKRREIEKEINRVWLDRGTYTNWWIYQYI